MLITTSLEGEMIKLTTKIKDWCVERPFVIKLLTIYFKLFLQVNFKTIRNKFVKIKTENRKLEK